MKTAAAARAPAPASAPAAAPAPAPAPALAPAGPAAGNAAAASAGAPPPAPAAASAVGNGAQAASAGDTAAASGLVRPPAPDAGTAAGPIQGLRAAPPSAAAAALASAETNADAMLAGERKRLANGAPSMTAPTGLPAAPPRAEAMGLPAGEAPAPAEAPSTRRPPAAQFDPESVFDDLGFGEPIAAPATAFAGASAAAIAASTIADEESGLAMIVAPIDVASLLKRAQADESVDTSAGERPKIALTDDLNPGQAGDRAAPKDAATQDAAAAAVCEQGEDPGIAAIRPEVEPRVVSGSAGAVAAPELAAPIAIEDEIPPEVTAGFDQTAAGQWDEATAQALADHDARFAERTTGEAREWANTDDAIVKAQAKATSDQQAAIDGAQGEADAATAQWRTDIDAARTTYQGSRKTAADKLDTDVNAARDKGERDAACELDKGERQARGAEAETRGKVADQRAEVERQSKESDGFLDWLADKVSDLFDALADFINDAFNALRSLVSTIIDGAKKLARAAINFARDAINFAIDIAAEAFSLAADVFLAAFPEARDRAKKWINEARDTAKDAVNKAASWLADRIDQLLDALGAALDFILSVYQRAYLAILNAIRALVVGFIKVMRGIARLVDAAKAMPNYFEGEVETELIGQDLTQPLFFERSGDAAPALTGPDGALEPVSEADLALVGQDRLPASQVAVDEVADFAPDPAFFQNHPIPDGGELEFPSETEGADQAPALDGAEEMGGPTAGTENEGGGEAAPAEEMTTEQRLQTLMDAEPNGSCEAKDAPSNQTFPEDQKFGPLTRGQRARYLLSQMGKGIKQWFACNWPKVLLAAIAALVGIIALEILTGGLITAALPILLEVLAAVMIGAAVVKAGAHIGDYLSKGWDGDIQGAGRSLAKGLAVGAVELIFAVLTYITAGAFKVLAAAVKGVGRVVGAAARGVGKLGRVAARGAARAGRAIARVAKAGGRRVGAVGERLLKSSGKLGRAVLVRGKLVIRSLRRGFARGVRSVRDLAKRVGKWFRFKRFKIVRVGKWFELYGEVNPWVLLATGKIIEVNVEGRPMLGDAIEVKGVGKGVLVGVNEAESVGVKSLRKLTLAERRAVFRRASKGGRAALLEDLAGANLTGENARELRKAMKAAGKKFRAGQEAHHLVASTHPKAQQARDILKKVGIEINEAINGLAIGGKRHARLHTTKAINAINAEVAAAYQQGLKRAAQAAPGQAEKIIRDEVRKALDAIATRIKSGKKFP